MLYQLAVQLNVTGEHRVLIRGSEFRAEEQARTYIPIVWGEHALRRAPSDSCLPQG
jgi:hypothetical protein